MKKNKYFWTAILSFSLFIPLAYLAKIHNYFPLDLKISNFIQSFNASFLRDFLIFISVPGYGTYKFILLFFIVIFLIFKKLNKEAVMLLFAALGAEAVSYLVKITIFRIRPASDLIEYIYRIESSPSFPSGHVTLYIGFFGFLLYLTLVLIKDKTLRLLAASVCVLFIIFVGISRIYLGAHWFSDVVGGYLLGIFWLLISIMLYNSWLRYEKSKKSKNKINL